jgi:hypothetical protein
LAWKPRSKVGDNNPSRQLMRLSSRGRLGAQTQTFENVCPRAPATYVFPGSSRRPTLSPSSVFRFPFKADIMSAGPSVERRASIRSVATRSAPCVMRAAPDKLLSLLEVHNDATGWLRNIRRSEVSSRSVSRDEDGASGRFRAVRGSLPSQRLALRQAPASDIRWPR